MERMGTMAGWALVHSLNRFRTGSPKNWERENWNQNWSRTNSLVRQFWFWTMVQNWTLATLVLPNFHSFNKPEPWQQSTCVPPLTSMWWLSISPAFPLGLTISHYLLQLHIACLSSIAISSYHLDLQFCHEQFIYILKEGKGGNCLVKLVSGHTEILLSPPPSSISLPSTHFYLIFGHIIFVWLCMSWVSLLCFQAFYMSLTG